eukprot:1156748-Pelagomonas_calceolata.AAC.17
MFVDLRPNIEGVLEHLRVAGVYAGMDARKPVVLVCCKSQCIRGSLREALFWGGDIGISCTVLARKSVPICIDQRQNAWPVRAQELQVEFEFFSPEEKDFLGLKALLVPYLNGQEFDSSALIDAIIAEVRPEKPVPAQFFTKAVWFSLQGKYIR